MRIACLALAASLLGLAALPTAWADDSAPVTEPTAPAVVVQPTAPPVVVVPTSPPQIQVEATTPPAPVPVDTPAPDTGPVNVVPEHNPAATVNQVPETVATQQAPQPEQSFYPTATAVVLAPQPPAAQQIGPQKASIPAPSMGSSASTTSSSPAEAPPPQVSNPPADVPSTSNGDASTSVIDVNSSASYQAPAQLACTGKPKPASGPFMVAPYSGWSELVSFVDHDYPDYAVDGKIIIANGLEADASEGSASDFFPSYWSPQLRQYVNYDGHNGYDIGISFQPVLAAADGTVEFAGWNGPSPYDGYGQMVLINHHNGYVTLYGHLSKLEVQTGDTVQAGEEIGISGSTGRSSGPHLHFSVFHNCQVTDPYGWTGSGQDPLFSFNGEQSSYLWLPGHDPLFLNPPPNWPSFPIGLKVPVMHSMHAAAFHVGKRLIPPVDRLLLLTLPAPRSDEPVNTSFALARTEAQVTQEAEALAPFLQDLKAQGVISNYQVIPAAAAIWVRGTATAAQLEGLPGVASLSGVRPVDLQAAQAGLSHSVLIQVGHQQAPSLWPVGFRSALHAWSPMTAIAVHHSLVSGFAPPGRTVTITLLHGISASGEAEATGDPETGGFAAMLHDTSGKPVTAEVGEIVEIRSDGKSALTPVRPLTMRARPNRIEGTAAAGSTISITLADPSGMVISQTITTASTRGTFRTDVAGPLPAGSEAVAEVVDAAGNQESVSAYVPGVMLSARSAMVRGWTVGAAPRLWVSRDGRLLLTHALTTAPDGTFRIELKQHGQPLPLEPGDKVRLGSPWHSHLMTVHSLKVTLSASGDLVRVQGPPAARVHISLNRPNGLPQTATVTLNTSGFGLDHPRPGTIEIGTTAMAEEISRSGDTTFTTAQVRGVVVRLGSAVIRGQTRPSTTLTIQALSASGKLLGGSVVTSDGRTGKFVAKIQTRDGRAYRMAPTTRLLLRDSLTTTEVTIPALAATLHPHKIADITLAAPGTRVILDVRRADGNETVQHAIAGTSGKVRGMHTTLPGGSSQVTLTDILTDDVSAVRVFILRGTSRLDQVGTHPGPTPETRHGFKQARNSGA